MVTDRAREFPRCGGARERELEANRRARRAAPASSARDEKAPRPLAVGIQITPELVTSVAGLIAAIGVAIKNGRDNRRERRSRRRHEKALRKVARAAAKDSPSVAGAVDELERTGSYQFAVPDDDDKS